MMINRDHDDHDDYGDDHHHDYGGGKHMIRIRRLTSVQLSVTASSTHLVIFIIIYHHFIKIIKIIMIFYDNIHILLSFSNLCSLIMVIIIAMLMMII